MSDLEEIKLEVEIKEEEFDYETHTPSCPYFNSYVNKYDEFHDGEIKEEPDIGPESLMAKILARGSGGKQSAYTGKGKQTIVIRSDALGLKRSAIQSTNSHGRSLLPIEELDQELAKKGVDVNSFGVKRKADDSENLDKEDRRRKAKKQCDCHRNDNKKPRRVVKRNPNVDNFLKEAKEEASKGLHDGYLEDESSDDYAPEDDRYESSDNDRLGNNEDQSDDDYVPAKDDYTSKRTVTPKKNHNIFPPKKKLQKSSLQKTTNVANKNNSSSKFATQNNSSSKFANKNLKPTTNSESTSLSTPPGESHNAAALGDEFSRDTTSTSGSHGGVGATNDEPKKTTPGRDGGAKGTKETREYRSGKTKIHYGAEQKKKFIQHIEDGVKTSNIVKQMKVPESSVRSIHKNKDKIKATLNVTETLVCGGTGRAKRAMLLATDKSNLLVITEHYVMKWLARRLMEGASVYGQEIRAQAVKIYETLCSKKNVTNPPAFNASRGWLHQFRKRCNMKLAHYPGEVTSAVPGLSDITEANIQAQVSAPDPQQTIDSMMRDDDEREKREEREARAEPKSGEPSMKDLSMMQDNDEREKREEEREARDEPEPGEPLTKTLSDILGLLGDCQEKIEKIRFDTHDAAKLYLKKLADIITEQCNEKIHTRHQVQITDLVHKEDARGEAARQVAVNDKDSDVPDTPPIPVNDDADFTGFADEENEAMRIYYNARRRGMNVDIQRGDESEPQSHTNDQ